eukprot:1816426-Prymnesium_polylepis.1
MKAATSPQCTNAYAPFRDTRHPCGPPRSHRRRRKCAARPDAHPSLRRCSLASPLQAQTGEPPDPVSRSQIPTPTRPPSSHA